MSIVYTILYISYVLLISGRGVFLVFAILQHHHYHHHLHQHHHHHHHHHHQHHQHHHHLHHQLTLVFGFCHPLNHQHCIQSSIRHPAQINNGCGKKSLSLHDNNTNRNSALGPKTFGSDQRSGAPAIPPPLLACKDDHHY